MVQNIRNQSKIVEEKIKALSQIKNHLDYLDKEISQNIEYGLDKVFIKHNEKRNYLNYDITSNSPQELDLNLREVMLDLDKKKYPFSVTLGSTVSYKNLNKEELYITKLLSTIINIALCLLKNFDKRKYIK